MMFIYGRGKDDNLTSAMPQPTKEDLKFKGWKVKKNMVRPLLINLMNSSDMGDIILYEAVQEIWEATRKTYSNINDITKALKIPYFMLS